MSAFSVVCLCLPVSLSVIFAQLAELIVSIKVLSFSHSFSFSLCVCVCARARGRVCLLTRATQISGVLSYLVISFCYCYITLLFVKMMSYLGILYR